jgi:uncharacterized protein YbjT (DUF2867 family)
MKSKKVALAGATGYLGRYILKELIARNIPTVVVVRNPEKLEHIKNADIELCKADLGNPKQLEGIFKEVDTLISTVGITRQKDGLTYMDVDYQINKNLLEEAKNSGVRKMIYVSAYKGDQMRQLKIAAAKEKFVDELKTSGMEYTIMRPTGFFSDMADFLQMAKKGKIYLFGDGQKKLNPIHGADLAKVCVDAIEINEQEINVGGPDVLTHQQIGELALKAYGKPPKTILIPDFIRRLTIFLVRTFTSSKTYGPIEFFLTAMNLDMDAPPQGYRILEDFYLEEVKNQK